MEEYSVKKIRKHLDQDSGRFYTAPAPQNGIYTSTVWESGVWHMVYERDKKKKQKDKLIRSFYWCTVCKDLVYLEQGPKGNSGLRRHPCYQAYLKKKQNEKLLEEAQQKMKIKKERKDEKNKESSDDETNSDLDSDLDSDSDSDSDVGQNLKTKSKNVANRLTKDQSSMLARIFYKFRKICIQPRCSNKDFPVDSQTFFEIMPKTWNSSEW